MKDREQQNKTIKKVILKTVLITIVILIAIVFTDKKGFFNPDNRNNHTLKKWDSFYDFTKKNDLDILLIGNSHLYTGINPKNLSCALGVNAFILASPGTRVIDHYYSLEEAIKVSKPKLVIIETYGIKEHEVFQLKKGPLSDQFKSFSARRDFSLKLKSTPYLFSAKHYPYAWSNTLRNHDFIFNNYKQISNNIQLSKKRKKKQQKLYLGRYVRFQTGVEDSVLNLYNTKGSPVNGADFKTNNITTIYINKIIGLCKENNIQLMFLTLPMYNKHIENYSLWRNKLKLNLDEFGNMDHWLDLQIPENYSGFSRSSFENTYKTNQHMTYSGSLLATYKLVDFINTRNFLANYSRKTTQKWRNVFYADEGFFENNTPVKHDKNNRVLYKDKNIEILLLQNSKYNTLLAKVNPITSKKNQIELESILKSNNTEYTQKLVLNLDIYHSTKSNLNYLLNINKQVENIEIIGIENL